MDVSTHEAQPLCLPYCMQVGGTTLAPPAKTPGKRADESDGLLRAGGEKAGQVGCFREIVLVLETFATL